MAKKYIDLRFEFVDVEEDDESILELRKIERIRSNIGADDVRFFAELAFQSDFGYNELPNAVISALEGKITEFKNNL